jgi:hypothetical protein
MVEFLTSASNTFCALEKVKQQNTIQYVIVDFNIDKFSIMQMNDDILHVLRKLN